MAQIIYNFGNTSTLNGMVPPALGGGVFGNAALPPTLAGSGMYIIYNHLANNRYIGISRNLARRFGTRMAVVTELGFSPLTMTNVAMWWGTVAYRNSGVMTPAVPHGNYGPGGMTVNIDGQIMNLEHLLIRFVLNRLGAGGTISNNVFANAPITNTTGNPIAVHFDSASNAYFPAYQTVFNWAHNAAI